MTHGDGLLKKNGEPLGCSGRIGREGKRLRWNSAIVTGNRKRHGTEIRRKCRANQVDSYGALAIHPLAVNRIERPGAIVFEAAARPDARFLDVHWIERFDGMNADIGEVREDTGNGHQKSLAEPPRAGRNVAQ